MKPLSKKRRSSLATVAVLISVVLGFTGGLRLTVDLDLDLTAVSGLRRLGR